MALGHQRPAPAAPLGETFRTALRRVASSVAVVTAGRGATAAGMTATAVTSLCLDPPTLIVCVNRANRLHRSVQEAGRFRVTWLRREDAGIARTFSVAGRSSHERFSQGAWRLDDEVAPRLDHALADVGCSLANTLDYGSHTIFIGKVEEASVGEGVPLVYCDGSYGGLAVGPDRDE